MGVGIAHIIVAAFAYKSYEKTQEAAAEQKIAQKKQTAMEQVRLAASRRQQIREERVRRAQILQRAETLGVGASSGAAGATGAVGTTTAANLGAQFGEGVAVSSISQNLQKSADLKTEAANWQAASNLSMNIFSSTR